MRTFLIALAVALLWVYVLFTLMNPPASRTPGKGAAGVGVEAAAGVAAMPGRPVPPVRAVPAHRRAA